MKKLTLIILAVLLCASFALTGCQDNQQNDKINNETNIEASAGSVTEFHNAIEAKLEESQEKFDSDKEILLTVNGIPMSAAAVRYANIACNTYYAGMENAEQLIADEIDSFYRLNAAVVSVAKEKDAGISDELWQTQLVDNINNFKATYGENYDTIFEEYANQTPFFFFLNQVYNILYSNLYEVYSEDEEFRAEAKAAALEDMAEFEYVRAKHVLIQFPAGEGENGEVTEAQKAEVLAKATEVAEKAKNGEDFDALVAEYNEDPGMQANPGGYYFTRGEMVEPFENTAYALNEGEISDPVETTFGYHVILKLPLDDESITNSEVYINAAYDILRNELVEISKDYEINYADNYDEKVAEYVAEYNEMTYPTEE